MLININELEEVIGFPGTSDEFRLVKNKEGNFEFYFRGHYKGLPNSVKLEKFNRILKEI